MGTLGEDVVDSEETIPENTRGYSYCVLHAM